jgi:DNA polymerase-3 subunit beta
MSFTIQIPVDILKAAALCASTDHHRYYINGVFVDPRGYLVATDGHRLFAAQLELGSEPIPADGVIIPNAAIKKALTGIKPGRGFDGVLIELTADRLGDTIYQPVDGTYPDWKRVVPTEASGVIAQFNPAYVGDFGKAAKILGDKKGAPTFWHNGDGPAGVEFTRDGCFGVLIPMRVDGKGTQWDAFVKRILAK